MHGYVTLCVPTTNKDDHYTPVNCSTSSCSRYTGTSTNRANCTERTSTKVRLRTMIGGKWVYWKYMKWKKETRKERREESKRTARRKHDVIHKTGSTKRISTPSEEDWATATGNMHKNFGEIRPCGFRVMRADRQTDRQTDKQTNYNTSDPSRGRSSIADAWAVDHSSFLACNMSE